MDPKNMTQDQRQALWVAAGHAGIAPVGYGGESGGGNNMSGAVPRGPAVAPFNFDYDAAEKDALAKLTPYYQQMLDLNNGDIERAKQAIEADYQSGKRQRVGDYTGQMTQENIGDQQDVNKSLDDLNSRGILFQENAPGQAPQNPQPSGQEAPLPTEVANANAGSQVTTPVPTLNKPQQGIGYSQFATQQIFDPLLDQQQQRRAAIQRAIQRQGESAGINYTKDLGNTTSQGLQSNLQLNQEKQDKAMGIADAAQSTALNKYNASVTQSQVNPYIQ